MHPLADVDVRVGRCYSGCMDLHTATVTLERALSSEDRYGLSEILDELAEGTCDAAALIPLLERIAAKGCCFCDFDDNGAGGYPRAVGKPVSYADEARKAIENIRENRALRTASPNAASLMSCDEVCVAAAIEEVARGEHADPTLLPILEKLARIGQQSYNRRKRQLGEAALRAMERVRSHVEAPERSSAARLAAWNSLDEAQRERIVAVLDEHAADRAKLDRDVYASNFSDAPMVEVYRCTGDRERLTVDYLFHWWEWCPAQSGSDWNYHCVYRGTASFTGDTLTHHAAEPLQRDYVHESDEDAYDREAVLNALRSKLL
jgi:hypothetical protein